MFKKLSTTFVLLSFVMIQSIWAQSLLNNSREEARITGEKVKINLQTIYFDHTEDVLFDNGPLVNLPGGGFGGADASVLQSTSLGMGTYGFGAQQTANNSVADDFTSSASWNIETISFFSYQTGSTTTSTITGVYVQIWDGDPSAGGSVIYGDLTTNRLASTSFSNIYRSIETDLLNNQRPIMKVDATINTTLPAGTYWVQWQYTGSLASGPWAPPITIAGQSTTGNALQNQAGTWLALTDIGPQGLPFIITGTSGAPCPVGPATNPTPVDGAVDVDINPGNATWTNGAGTTQVEVFFGESGNMVSDRKSVV